LIFINLNISCPEIYHLRIINDFCCKSLVEQEGIVASFALELIEDALGKEEFEHYFPVLQWNLEEGDAVIFHRQALHSSYGNTDSVTRMALSTRWGTEARLNLTLKARYSQ